MKRNSWFLGFLVLALLATVARGEQSLEDIKWGIVQNMQANYQACNEENMEKLLGTMSEEMPNKKLFTQMTDMAWSCNDTYNKLEDVEVLTESDELYANCEFPYATAWVTQTIVALRTNDARNSVFKSRCETGKCKNDVEMAHKMGLATKTETTKLQMLFKYENGEWKLVAGITDPIPAGKDALQAEREEERSRAVEFQVGGSGGSSRRRSGQSVFN